MIGATLPLARMAEAHDLLENGTAWGLRWKVSIDVTGEALAFLPTYAGQIPTDRAHPKTERIHEAKT